MLHCLKTSHNYVFKPRCCYLATSRFEYCNSSHQWRCTYALAHMIPSCFRSCAGDTIGWNPQFPVQTGPAAGPSVHVPRQARLGTVLLQGGDQGERRPGAQKPTGLHRYEPNRSQCGATRTGGELGDKGCYRLVVNIVPKAYCSAIHKEL